MSMKLENQDDNNKTAQRGAVANAMKNVDELKNQDDNNKNSTVAPVANAMKNVDKIGKSRWT